MIKNRKINRIIIEVIEKLKAEYEPDKIILYGSYAYGTPDKDSDIDLLIIKTTDKRWVDRFAEVKKLIYDPARRISISPIVYTPLEIKNRLADGDGFLEEVVSKGKVLYAR